MNEPVTIFVVLDPEYGDRINDVASQGPVWLTSSDMNRAAVERYWKTSPRDAHGVTYWSEPRTGATEEEWLGILDSLEVHHSEPWAGPGIAGLEVIGAFASPQAQVALSEYGYEITASTPVGFSARRTATPN
jgi:hypothetical protein